MWTLPPPAASVIETIQPPQPLLGLLTPKIVVPVLEEALLAEAVALPFPVTYMIPPPVVDLVMEAEISDHRGPRQTDMKTHLMDGSLEVRGHTEVKQPRWFQFDKLLDSTSPTSCWTPAGTGTGTTTEDKQTTESLVETPETSFLALLVVLLLLPLQMLLLGILVEDKELLSICYC